MWTSEGRRKRDNLARAATFEGFDKLVNGVMAELPQTIIERVKSTGAGASDKGGSPKAFSPYSEGYKKKRRTAGKGTSKKDFDFTGSLWESFKLVGNQITGSTLTFIYNVTGQNSDSRRSNSRLADIHSSPRQKHKLGGWQDEGTNILYPNGKELQDLEEKLQQKVNEYFRNLLR